MKQQIKIFFYNFDEIEKITKEKIVESQNNSFTGYDGTIQLGYNVGASGGYDRISLNIINGYSFNSYFSTGLGVGLRYYPKSEALLIPVFMHLRAHFIDKMISPFLSADLGYAFGSAQGVYLCPTLGFSINFSNKNRLLIGFGYELQNDNSGYGSYNSNAILVNIGFSF